MNHSKVTASLFATNSQTNHVQIMYGLNLQIRCKFDNFPYIETHSEV